MSESASAPASCTARAMAVMSVTFGVSFTITGFFAARFTASVTRAAMRGSVPKPMPPSFTFGQEILSSYIATLVSLSSSVTATYSSTLCPARFAITGTSKFAR